ASMDPMVLHVAFISTDIKKDWDRLLAAGGSGAIEPRTSPEGDEMAFLRDPWGVCIQLIKRGKPLLS
ncbi:MAG: VOC family protein, partial [Gemmataceae bacterium]